MNREMDLTQIERALKGAPAAIFLALVLHGGPQTAKNLGTYTAYSEKVVRQGLAQLMEVGLVYYDSDLRAWYLVPRTKLLCLLQESLLAPHAPGYLANKKLSTGSRAGEDITAITVDSTAIGAEFTAGECGSPDHVGEESAAVAVDFTAIGEESAGGGNDRPDNEGEESTAVPVDFTATGEDSTAVREESSTSPGYITTTTTIPDPEDQVVVSKQGKPAKKGFPRFAAGSREKILVDWLARGGIGRRTPKMLELLACDLDLETVKAHVLERLAWEAGLVPDGPDYLPGLLIHRLLGDDPPPPMRCDQCLHLPNKLGYCACDLDELIRR